IRLMSGLAVVLTSCDENSYNDRYLDGFESDPEVTDVKSIDYTLTANDYKVLAATSGAKALAGDELKSALENVGKQGYFTDAIPAKQYIPFLLSSSSFPYFSLSNNSAINVTYQVAVGQPEEVAKYENAGKWSPENYYYQVVWESKTDYTNAFTPSHPASKYLPVLLKEKYMQAEDGDCVVVTYNYSAEEPDFGKEPEPEPEFTPSSVLGDIVKDAEVTVAGYVAAVSTQGPIVTDATGSVFVYAPANNSDLKVGDQVTFTAAVSTYNYGFQIAKGATLEVVGTQKVTNPAPRTWTATEIDDFVAASIASGAEPIKPIYSKFTGTVTVSGNYINIVLDGTSVQVSPYGLSNTTKAMFTDGATVTFEGYMSALAGKGKYLNTIITKVGSSDVSTLALSRSLVDDAEYEDDDNEPVAVSSEKLSALYVFDGAKWSEAQDAVVLNDADYKTMGQTYNNLSGDSPAVLLPRYLMQHFPYAVEGDAKFVVYNYYTGSATVQRCASYEFDGTAWAATAGVVDETAQFVKVNGKWIYDPTVRITLPVGRNQPVSQLYYQACVDWVKVNVPDGPAYISSYGNNDFYCGANAYEGNVSIATNSARNQYAGYADMSDEEIVSLIKTRFESEVFPQALAAIHPDAEPIEGVDVYYIFNFGCYSGTKPVPTYDITYKVVAKGQFEFISCTWNDTPAE
ncbi:MAG: hypothetical protein K2M94_03065, partial [Paramuribaculum sp.]|nr:hypothetical protein [Paramuribaculum sp.]